MDDAALLRYSRHLMLDEIGVDGQERFLAARALIVGLGGLGCAAASYLAAAGVGAITLVDHDTVDWTNLQRQVLHTEAAVGEAKVISAQRQLAQRNSEVRWRTVTERASPAWLLANCGEHDLVLDCTDNFVTRQAINAACVHAGVPLVSGSALRFDGQVIVFDRRVADCPCYACLYPPTAKPTEAQCATMGVFGPLVGLVGSLQAAEALKLLAPCGPSLLGRLLMIDALRMRFDTITLERSPSCPVCGPAQSPVHV